MNRPPCRISIAQALSAWLALAALLSVPSSLLRAQVPHPATERPSDSWQVARIEPALPSIIEQQEAFDWCESPAATPCDCNSQTPCLASYSIVYDNGFVIQPDDPDASPFSLKINNQNTFRYSGFARDEATWTDSAGNINPITSSSNFVIPRGRLIFSGNAFAPDISYLLNIDYNSVGRNAIGFRAFSLSYRFSKALEVSVGQNKVPGSREWLLSSWVAQEGPDRSMATTFFRPSLSQGIWARGELLDGLHYHAMLANGFNTLNLTPTQFNHRLCWSDSIWWEPWGDFGPGYCDLEDHQQLVVRAGTSYTFALARGNQADSDTTENSALRLSDGTLITQPGALAPGVTLQRYDVSLIAFDLAFKVRGCSLSAEVYLQDLSSLQGNGPLPINSTAAQGGFLQGGYFVLPQRLEFYSRTSFVTGRYGSGTEVAGGMNWFPIAGQSNLRFTFDVAQLESSPADQNRTGFVAGQSGLLLRTQINSSF